MIEFKTGKPEILIGMDGKGRVTFTLDRQKAESMAELKDRDYVVTIKEYRQHRSQDANAYCWVLITEIANVLRTDKDSVYLMMLKRYGQREFISVQSNIDLKGFVKYYDIAGTGTVNGVEFTHYYCYKGSSEYDTKEMAIFIDGVISEAQALGIDTRTPDEVENMKSLWRSYEINNK